MLRAYASSDVRRAEGELVASAPTDALMKQAADGVAAAVSDQLTLAGATVHGSTVLALVGGGDNGGDALYAAKYLADSGAKVQALLVSRKVHQRALAAAKAAGVQILQVASHTSRAQLRALVAKAANRAGVWIDGIVGTGGRGPLRSVAATVVGLLISIRDSSPDEPIVVAIDIPSGLGGEDGKVVGPHLAADVTVTMGRMKNPSLLPPACLSFGRVEVVELGPIEAPVSACRLGRADVADLWQVPGRADHKYTRGVVEVVAGSDAYPATGIICAKAAARAGAGMVRVNVPAVAAPSLFAVLPEAVPGAGRSQAVVVGPGLDLQDEGRVDEMVRAATKAILRGLPVVVDAGGISIIDRILARLPERAESMGNRPVRRVRKFAPNVVLTPHAGEAAQLATRLGFKQSAGGVARSDIEAGPAKWAGLLAEKTGATVLLKGPVTVVCGPEGDTFTQAEAPGWTATAGAGDALAGIVGTVLAMLQAEAEAAGPALGAGQIAAGAAAGTWVHSVAARLAAGLDAEEPYARRPAKVGRPILASDIVEAVPRAVEFALAP
ncbi:MAG: NAD(P)H-hydrate epimerase [Winkia neuii]|uniref:ADP-dependent (S)-NAD(P)H-hydrate dehydratase n=1 Tax=Winkia neuii TaxID=33007 RepID=A0A2I1INP9_9ACTO|nr:bifunctional ADP-dependent NAD(P)H-hydrate dehydratase/NAD(P)H-hydrate epimerase [Winkia neuii]OFJ71516.1 hypothetical protein HMPREF2851_06705 [Actinomyces sp. HMSC064C12]OFK01166.1 hypothetical protein HMPREF2835_10390 [Actinomyces sp. HMSC072A03]OFT55793.1 hypothetical protein HMPREF3152_03830 [Actinomyces sp. HMSC06A08]KWZ73141.1 putative YjeF-like protein [Winkia neuii]MDK8099018.1 NAD(P)H-hydrate epimerase [Winkia neuii]